jgi:hypothetical protein
MKNLVLLGLVLLVASLASAQNETCDTSELVAALPFNTTTDNSAATPDGPPSACNSSSAIVMQNDLWFTFEVNSTCDFSITVDPDAGLGYDGVIALYSGSCASLTEVTCADDPEPQTIDIFGAAPGTTYFLQIGDWGTSAGGGVTTVDIVEVVAGSCGVVPVELMSFEVQ